MKDLLKLQVLRCVRMIVGRGLNLAPEGGPRVVRIQVSELPQNLLGALVAQLRDSNLHRNDFITPVTLVRSGGHALLPHAEFLSALGAGRDAELGASVDGGDFDAGAERGFGDGDGEGEVYDL